jgi:dihydrofolate reductase
MKKTENNMKISIISAIDKNRGIGKDNKLLIHFPEDLKHFKEITSGNPVIMGETTYLSMGKPLPNRDNIVLTLDPELKIEGCLMARSIDESIEIAKEKCKEKSCNEIFIIGGASIYKQFIDKADKLYLTLIDKEFEADTFFPEYEDKFTKLVKEEIFETDKLNYKFIELEK